MIYWILIIGKFPDIMHGLVCSPAHATTFFSEGKGRSGVGGGDYVSCKMLVK